MQSLELLFDPVTEMALRSEWAALSNAGLPSSERNTSPSNRPHVTVVVARDGLERTLDSVRSTVGELLPLAVTVGGCLVFPSSRGSVLSRSIVISRDLLALHARVVEAVSQQTPVLETARIGAWTPHSTIARRLSAEQLGQAVAHLPAGSRTGTVRALRLWDSETRTVTLVAGRDAGTESAPG